MRHPLLAAATAALMAAMGPAAAERCQLKPLASLDLNTDPRGSLSIPATINGHAVAMLVDTGGVVSMLSEKTVGRLGLEVHALRGGMLEMFDGQQLRSYVDAPGVKLGDLVADRLAFVVMPDGRLDSADGTLAPDILRNYDIEFDFAAAKFKLYAHNQCGGDVVYWTRAASAVVPMRVDRTWHIRVPVSLNGVSLMADLDTGATRSVLPRSVALRYFNLATDAPADSLKLTSLALEGIEVRDPDVYIPLPGEKVSPDMDSLILGRSYLRRLHLYIAYQEQRIYLSAADAH